MRDFGETRQSSTASTCAVMIEPTRPLHLSALVFPFQAKYAVQNVLYSEDVGEWIKGKLSKSSMAVPSLNSSAGANGSTTSAVYLMEGLNTDSGRW